MRILQLSHSVAPIQMGGVEIHTRSLAQGLQTRGHDVLTVIPGTESLSVDCDIRVKAIHSNAVFRHGELTPRSSKDYWTLLEQTVREFAPDLVHVQQAVGFGWQVLQGLAKLDIPFTISLPDYWYLSPCIVNKCGGDLVRCATDCQGYGKRPLGLLIQLLHLRNRRKALIKLLNRLASPLVNLSEGSWAHYRELGVNHDRAVTIKWAAPDLRNTEMNRSTCKRPRIGFIGQCAPHKGVLDLICAFRIAAVDATLTIHGDGSDEYMRLLTSAATGYDIEFRGRYERHRICELLEGLDIVVVPSDWQETWGLVVQEAISTQCVVIASDVGGIREQIIHGRNGFLYPAGDQAVLAALLRSIVSQIETVRASLRFHVCKVQLEDMHDQFTSLFEWTIRNWAHLKSNKLRPIAWSWDSDIADIASICQIGPEDVSRKLMFEWFHPGSTVAAAWSHASPSTDDEVTEFYRGTSSYLFDLTAVHKTPERVTWRRAAADILTKYRVESVLDYAGGCGDDALYFCTLGFETTYYDISSANRALTTRKVMRCGQHIRILEEPPTGEVFDAVYCTEVLEHHPKPDSLMLDLAGLVKAGGLAIVTHSFDMVGPDFPQHLAQHAGRSVRFYEDAARAGFLVKEVIRIPSNRFYVLERIQNVEQEARPLMGRSRQDAVPV
jgi:glycosyltransferase involved in cell wall biosynthesis/SAM-dependent methyltransferase